MNARRAAVQPRVTVANREGDVVILEDLVHDHLRASSRGVIELRGPPGSGKTTALEHLAAVFEGEDVLDLLDGPSFADEMEARLGERLAVLATAQPIPGRGSRRAICELRPWTDDEVIEYAVHEFGHDDCRPILARALASPDRERLGGCPELWIVTLDAMRADPAIESVGDALRARLDSLLSPPMAQRARFVAKAMYFPERSLMTRLFRALPGWRFDPPVERLIRHEPVRVLLAADVVLRDLRDRARMRYLETSVISPALVDELASRLTTDANAPALERLREIALQRDRRCLAWIATVLHACSPGWRPRNESGLDFSDAVLAGAEWSGVEIPRVELGETNLEGADLTGANLVGGNAREASLARAWLTGARLERLYAVRADLSSAELSGADLRRARLASALLESAKLVGSNLAGATLRAADLREADFSNAGLRHADLSGAKLERTRFNDATFTGATLSGLDLRNSQLDGASFERANLNKCGLGGMELVAPDFRQAHLERADLTATRFPRADFRRARLVRAGLADIHWEDADLRGADLSDALFQMGSTRGGLVFSPIASFGTRTGFYQGDEVDSNFKSPEEIRKANLRGADLRGARVHRTDFYLVDLREAIFDEGQLDHFRRCGAILEHPGG